MFGEGRETRHKEGGRELGRADKLRGLGGKGEHRQYSSWTEGGVEYDTCRGAARYVGGGFNTVFKGGGYSTWGAGGGIVFSRISFHAFASHPASIQMYLERGRGEGKYSILGGG